MGNGPSRPARFDPPPARSDSFDRNVSKTTAFAGDTALMGTHDLALSADIGCPLKLFRCYSKPGLCVRKIISRNQNQHTQKTLSNLAAG